MSQCTKPKALQTQVGGNYYSKLTIQPLEFCMANHWDVCASNILKYVTRHVDKGGRKDLEKARHYVDVRTALAQPFHSLPLYWIKRAFGMWSGAAHEPGPMDTSVSVEAYCKANELAPAESQVLEALGNWVRYRSDRHRMELIVALDNLIHARYPVDKEVS